MHAEDEAGLFLVLGLHHGVAVNRVETRLWCEHLEAAKVHAINYPLGTGGA
jgi:hypothetical protein